MSPARGFPTMHEVSDAIKQAQQRWEGGSMINKALRELLECIDDGELLSCSMGDHAMHDTTVRGGATIEVAWRALKAPDALLVAARQVLHARGVTEHWGPIARANALTKLETAVANATEEDGPA